MPDPLDIYIPNRISHYGFIPLSISLKDVLQICYLDNYHNAPFDRLLIAQSQTRNISIMRADAMFSLTYFLN